MTGGGGREHALLWKLAQSPRRPTLFAAPGNAGTAEVATNLPVAADDVDALLDAARAHAIDLVIVGQEAALARGIVDAFRAAGIAICGPTRAAARIETSKAFAKQFMRQAGVPTAEFALFDDFAAASAHVRAHGTPLVVKADGLATGKGVVVAWDEREAIGALEACMVDRLHGDAGSTVVIEEYLSGQEVSVFAFSDGASVSSFVAACDYKRVGDGDTGPNTGGMGGYSPPPFWGADLERTVRERIVVPTVRALADAGSPYTGVLYAGLILTHTGPMVIEFNARFGDPETQLILPRLETDVLEVAEAMVRGSVASLVLSWSPDSTVGVVLASGGYPAAYTAGHPIAGLDALPSGTVAFQAGTSLRDGATVTSGGRVVTLVGRGPDLMSARDRAYAAAAAVRFAGAQYRRDIAASVLGG